MIDPLTSALVLAAGAYVGKETVGDAAKRILGPTWDVVGERLKAKLFGPHIGDVVVAAVALADEAGYEPQPVPGRLLMPLLEYSSLGDDDDLRAKWGALLANASRPEYGYRILPAYVDTMRQLTPSQARIVDWIYARRQPLSDEPGDDHHRRIERVEIESEFSLSKEDSRS